MDRRFGLLGLGAALLNACGSGGNPMDGKAGQPDASSADGSSANVDSIDGTSPDGEPNEAASDDGGGSAGPFAWDASPVEGGGVRLKPPFDWVGIVGTGQSLSVGVTSRYMSTTQPFHNLKLVDTGPDPKYPIASSPGTGQWATTPLVEPIRAASKGNGPGYSDGQYPNNIDGETPHSGMANTLSALWSTRGDYVTAHSVVGWSGHCLVDLDKAGGKRAYPASLNEARVWKSLAAATTKTFGYGAVVLTHGECDSSNGGYGAGLYQFWQDYNTDLKAITGQTADVVLLASQQSISASWTGGSAVQVWQASVAHSGQIVCTGPKYQYEYSPDHVHLPAPGYERLGQKYAEVFDLVFNQKLPWKPLQPNKVTRAGAVVSIDFDVPNPPLVWDAHITPPHQTANTEWAAGKGFEIKDAGGNNLKITNAAIQGSSVILTLATDPGAGKVSVGYALTQEGNGSQGGTNLGLRGLLRDSDDFTGYDAETIEGQLTNGSSAVTSTTGGAFVHRAGRDLVTGAGVPADTIVMTHDSDSQLTLSSPWAGASSKVMLSLRHDERNYCVHFLMKEM